MIEFLFMAFFLIVFPMFVGYWEYAREEESSKNNSKRPNIDIAIVNLISVAMRADNSTSKSELTLIKAFLLKGFGEARAKKMLLNLRDVLKAAPVSDIRRDCVKVNESLNYQQKLALLNLFLSIVAAEKPLKLPEVQFITLFARYVRIDTERFISMRRHYFTESEWHYASTGQSRSGGAGRRVETNRTPISYENAYKVLGLSTDADMAQVKHAYRNLVKQWHPDRFESRSDAEKEHAAIRFREIDEAYKKIMGKP